MRGTSGNVAERDLKMPEGKSRTRTVPLSPVGGNDVSRSHGFIRHWSQDAAHGATLS